MAARHDEAVGTMQEYGQSGAGSKASQDAAYFRSQGDADRDAANVAQTRGNYQANYSQADAMAAQGQAARGQQQSSIGLLAQAANGGAPSQATIAGQQQAQQAMAAQHAMAASARGPQAMALAQSQAAQNASAAQAQIGASTVAARANEMAQARDAYAQAAAQQRAGDLANQQQAAQQAQFTTSANMQQRAENDQYSLGLKNNANSLYNQEFNINAQQQNAHNQGVKNEQDYDINSQRVQNESSQQDWNMVKDSTQMLGNMIGGAMMSDERSKELVHNARSRDVEALIGSFGGKEYRYKEQHRGSPGAGDGDQYGPGSAQSIAKTKLGSHIVERGGDGMLRIDSAGALKAMMAGLAHVNNKVNALGKRDR